MTKPCTFHTYPNGAVRCFHCGEAKPLLPGTWPSGTWFQRRLALTRAREIGIALREAKQARSKGVMQ